jgi:3-oxocholest-4-en-26-oate---CoA ligase
MPDNTDREWSLPAAIDAVTDAAGDREMLVWTSVRRTYAEVQQRTKQLAAFLRDAGLGVHRERADLERWECGQSPIAVVLSNGPEYVETMIGAYRARAVPFNVNHHYHPDEVAALLDQVGAEAIVYHRRLGPLLTNAAAGRVLIDVDDGSGTPPLSGSVAYEAAIASAARSDELPDPSPDDLYLVCTGGTTGRPKGVLWRQGDIYVSGMGGVEGATSTTIAAATTGPPRVWFAAPPLMHAAAQWTVYAALHNGGTVILHDDAVPFAARIILETVERERANLLTIVGDAYARPLVEELRTRSYDLSSLQQLATGGAMTSPELKHALLELLPHIMIVDGYGASETGGMAYGASSKDAETQQFRGADDARVLSEDRTRLLAAGDDEIGWTARVGRVPLGYLDDREQTERTFPIVDGVRVAVPGDRARRAADGSIVLLGRDSLVVNSGGEKIFVEEVEEAVRRHPDVVDAVVIGRPSDRFGQEVVAIVQLRGDAVVTPADIRDFAARSIARFKTPRAVLVCERVARHPSGKADYRWAQAAALDAVEVTD